MTRKRFLEERGALVIEMMIIILLVAVAATVVVWSLQQRQIKEMREEVRVSLGRAAIAVEEYASLQDGDYSSTKGKTGEGLAKYGYRPVGDVGVTVAAAGPDRYCIVANEGDLGSDRWATASLDSSNGQISTDDDC